MSLQSRARSGQQPPEGRSTTARGPSRTGRELIILRTKYGEWTGKVTNLVILINLSWRAAF